MTAKSVLSKRLVLRITETFFFLITLLLSHIYGILKASKQIKLYRVDTLMKHRHRSGGEQLAFLVRFNHPGNRILTSCAYSYVCNHYARLPKLSKFISLIIRDVPLCHSLHVQLSYWLFKCKRCAMSLVK